MQKSAFTMVELIFVIVIIGILASVAIPKLSGVTDGAKKSAEIATISAVATALESANGEWSINEGNFTWGRNRPSSELNSTTGYPNDLSANNQIFGKLIKDSGKFKKIPSNLDDNISVFKGPASRTEIGIKPSIPDIAGKPDKNDFWIYAYNANDCNITCTNCTPKHVYYGDIVLIDVNGSDTTLPNITCN